MSKDDGGLSQARTNEMMQVNRANIKLVRRLILGKFSVVRLIRSTLLIYLLVLAFAFLFSDGMIFLPPLANYGDSEEVIKITTADDVQIAAIYLFNPAAEFTILYSHGNAEDLGTVRWTVEQIRDRGYSVFAYDYRGYGVSDGRASEKGVYRDIEAAYDHLTGDLGIDASKVILMGRSVGAAVALDFAAGKQVAGIILESPFLTAFRTVTRIRIAPFDKFKNIDKIGEVGCPKLFIHGTSDSIVPFAHGRRLFEMAGEPKMNLWVDGLNHNDDIASIAGESYWRAIDDFTKMVKIFGGR